MSLPNLTPSTLADAVAHLCGRDPDLAAVVERHGAPPAWQRPAGFATLVHMILEQQVSLASARAAFERIRAAAGELNPEALLSFDDADMLAFGFSRQKTRYARLLAEAVRSGQIDLDGLSRLPDADARQALTALTGIGPWTADVYLLMALMRPDVWPAGDLALAVAAQEVKGLATRPDPAALTELGERWRPVRAVAARILWHHYLSTPRRR